MSVFNLVMAFIAMIIAIMNRVNINSDINDRMDKLYNSQAEVLKNSTQNAEDFQLIKNNFEAVVKLVKSKTGDASLMKGDKGDQGPQGEKGEKGEKGDPG